MLIFSSGDRATKKENSSCTDLSWLPFFELSSFLTPTNASKDLCNAWICLGKMGNSLLWLNSAWEACPGIRTGKCGAQSTNDIRFSRSFAYWMNSLDNRNGAGDLCLTNETQLLCHHDTEIQSKVLPAQLYQAPMEDCGNFVL